MERSSMPISNTQRDIVNLVFFIPLMMLYLGLRLTMKHIALAGIWIMDRSLS